MITSQTYPNWWEVAKLIHLFGIFLGGRWSPFRPPSSTIFCSVRALSFSTLRYKTLSWVAGRSPRPSPSRRHGILRVCSVLCLLACHAMSCTRDANTHTHVWVFGPFDSAVRNRAGTADCGGLESSKQVQSGLQLHERGRLRSPRLSGWVGELISAIRGNLLARSKSVSAQIKCP